MAAWFPEGMHILSGDELTQARDLKKKECRFSIHESTEILLDQCGEHISIAAAAWTGEVSFSFEGERQVRTYSNALDHLPRESAVLRHIEVSALELNRWLEKKHPWVKYRFPVDTGQTAEKTPVAISNPINLTVLSTAPPKMKHERVGWRDIAMHYLSATYKAGTYKTCKEFHRKLVSEAKKNDSGSPFTIHDGELFVLKVSQSVAFKTLENAMPGIKKAAKTL